MVFFEIHQRFKGHFLNEMPVSFKKLFSFEKIFFSDKRQKFFRESIFFSLSMKKIFWGGGEGCGNYKEFLGKKFFSGLGWVSVQVSEPGDWFFQRSIIFFCFKNFFRGKV